LIVNDDPSQLRLIGAVLEKVGIATRGTIGVEEALASLAADPAVDLIVTDLHMPGIDGWQFCHLLRSPEYQSFNRVPILVVSATFSGSDAEQLSFDLGANGFLAAPFAPSALQEYARSLLEGRRPTPRAHLLLVQPDMAEAERLRAAFVQLGYVVDVARSGAEALRSWAKHHPEIALIDDRLTDMPADAVLAEVKKPGARTVAFAITHDEASREGLQLARRGADGSLPAPVDPQRLVALANTVRRQRSLMRIEELLEERGRALRDSEARWRSLFEAIPEIVVVHDEDGVIRHINQMGAEQLEWPAHELIGRNLRDFQAAAARREAGDRAVDGPSGATVLVARGGREIAVEINRRRMRFEGQPAVLSVARDVSARAELARQQQQFLAMLTHDIKNPLAVVLGFISLIGEVGALNDEQRDLVGRIEANANTVLTLVANYLNLTQIESGKLTITRRPTDVGSLLEAVAAQYRGQAELQGMTMLCDVPPDMGRIDADVVALERVLTNLVHNALKFTSEGGRVSLRGHRDGGEVIVEIADTGPGIAPDDLAQIFQPYRRGMVRQPREGVGLGLFIAQSLVHAHDGWIGVDSTLGQGTTFTIRLPLHAVHPAAAAGDA
jgi:PAS domain S-box-containing protein